MGLRLQVEKSQVPKYGKLIIKIMDSQKSTSCRPLTDDELTSFAQNGYLKISGFFSKQELEPIWQAIKENLTLTDKVMNYTSSIGSSTQFAYWTDLETPSMLSAIPRLVRTVEAVERLLSRSCYHWYSKLVIKSPESSSVIGWHQDYGGYYHCGCLYPRLLSTMIAISPSTVENGCVHVIPGSHLFGRLEHIDINGSYLTDPRWVEAIESIHQPVACELEVGDMLFFHGNTLHSSKGNRTNEPRIHLISHYNTVDNQPVFKVGQQHFPYRPLQRLSDDILEKQVWGNPLKDQCFMDPERPKNILVQVNQRNQESYSQ